MKRRTVVSWPLAGAVSSIAGPAALAQSAKASSKPLRLIVGASAGAANDVIARLVAVKLGEALGRVVIVENRLGNGGQLAATIVSGSAPDGSTLVLVSSAHASQAATLKSVPFEPISGLTWISTLVTYPFVIAVGANSPIRDIPDLIRRAKAAPGRISYSSAGVGSTLHLAAEWLSAAAGIQLNHVPYQGGGAAAYSDVVTGRLDLIWNLPGFLVPYIRAGNLRALAVTSGERYGFLPDVPALAETVPDVRVTSWLGAAAAPGTSAETVRTFSAAFKQVLAQKDLQQQLAQIGMQPRSSTPDEFRTLVEGDIAKFRAIAQSRHIAIE
jgi:tripartite-type tricarboxylate transporter receptor subunit TctC